MSRSGLYPIALAGLAVVLSIGATAWQSRAPAAVVSVQSAGAQPFVVTGTDAEWLADAGALDDLAQHCEDESDVTELSALSPECKAYEAAP